MTDMKRSSEFAEQEKLAELLSHHLDGAVFWTSLENAPRSRVSALGQQRRGVRSGLPDTIFIAPGLPPVFIELKSAGGALSTAQKKIAAALVAAARGPWHGAHVLV
jgi:hypothetical protein